MKFKPLLIRIVVAAIIVCGAIWPISKADAAERFTVTGRVIDQTARPIENVSVTAVASDNTSVVVSQEQTNSLGQYTLSVPAGTYNFEFKLTNYTGVVIVNHNNQNVVSDLSLTREMNRKNTVFGNITDDSGIPVANAVIDLIGVGVSDRKIVTTDQTGYYAASLEPGHYTIHARSAATPIAQKLPFYLDQISGQTIDMTQTDRDQDLTFSTKVLKINVKDTFGTPFPVGHNVTVGYYGTQSIAQGIDMSFAENAGFQTNSQGVVSARIYKGSIIDGEYISTHARAQICIDRNKYPADPDLMCTLVAQRIDSDLEMNIVITPTSPSGLNASSPTNLPVLSWNAVSPADSYNVYRDGILSASTTNTVYSDITVTDGQHTYTVAAVSNAFEGSHTNNVIVLVDQTNPTITSSLDTQPTSFGWYNSDVTASYICNDLLSGIVSCSTASVITTEGQGIATVGTAIDGAGNTSTTTVSVNLDKTDPAVGGLALSQSRVNHSQTAIITCSGISDALSGVSRVEYYYDSDPGLGNGYTMSQQGASATATTVTGLAKGDHVLYCRSEDKAGNWSALSSPVVLTVLN